MKFQTTYNYINVVILFENWLIEKAVLMISLFSEDNSELMLQEISERMNLNKSTARCSLNTLKYSGKKEFDG